MKIKKIAIVGGGTAGWLAANHIGMEIVSKRQGVSVTVIESKEIPTIGVGEGTVAVIRGTLESFGINEAELLLRCDATFKIGIKFIDWLDVKKGKKNNYFYHPFDMPYPMGIDATNYWLANKPCEFSALAKSYLLAEKNLSPKYRDSPPYQGAVNYAYHFDARKFAGLLAENATKKFGVIHKENTVLSCSLTNDGFIGALNYSNGEVEEFDFYIDCSGFSALLIGGALDVKMVDKTSQIFSDQALTLQIPTEESEEIFPYTKATAHKAGWIWDIPLTTRRGTGFVYSSAHMTEQEAVSMFAKYHGEKFREDNIRKIPMSAGYREKFWVKNCAALGLAQGFIEPLEATSIAVTDRCAALVASLLPDCLGDIELRANQVNQRVQQTWERLIDFVQLHYFISDRRDSDFWMDCRDENNLSDALRERILLWSRAMPTYYDYAAHVEFFQRESFLALLYGMDFQTATPSLDDSYCEFIRGKLDEHFKSSESLAATLISNRQWFTEFHSYAKSIKK